MRKEIGGQFWNINKRTGKAFNYEGTQEAIRFLYLGRGALSYIIQDIKIKYPYIDKVWMPAYCCESMIMPFTEQGIQVKFYEVIVEEAQGITLELPSCSGNEILYFMNYFGYEVNIGQKNLLDKGTVLIEDCTQSYLSKKILPLFTERSYSFASLRKWTGFSGLAIVYCHDSAFQNKIELETAWKYDKMFQEASTIKYEYLNGGNIDKNDFWNIYKQAEQMFNADYRNYKPTEDEIAGYGEWDKPYDAAIRRRNAAILSEIIKDIEGIKMIYTNVDSAITPMYMPVLVEKEVREKLVRFLIQRHIYCPVHWPLGKLNDNAYVKAKTLYDKEISLVCDQRYGEADMISIGEAIKEFFR